VTLRIRPGWAIRNPGATLVALIVHEGVADVFAGAVVWVIVRRIGNIVLSMIAGVVIVGVLG